MFFVCLLSPSWHRSIFEKNKPTHTHTVLTEIILYLPFTKQKKITLRQRKKKLTLF
jgi:hypothetical protein